MPMKTFKYRLYPTKKQAEKLEWALIRCCELYNAALQEPREMFKYTGKGTTYNVQANQLSDKCGCELDRDHNVALNIKARWLGRSHQEAEAS